MYDGSVKPGRVKTSHPLPAGHGSRFFKSPLSTIILRRADIMKKYETGISSEPLKSPAIVLCGPQIPGNVGAVARAMANFELSDLRLVNPCNHLAEEARMFAVGATHVLEAARVYPDLAAAISDLQMTVATTRREGRLRGRMLDSTQVPALLGSLPDGARTGLVFGREQSGLTSEEVALCSHTAAVTTSNATGSLNLAQAVVLFLYELARQPQSAVDGTEEELPTQQELDGMFAQMAAVLERIAFLNPSRPEAALNRLRRLISRAHPDRSEVALLRGLWSQLSWSINDWRGRKRGS
jgi:tRNA/rRNA methyltransferase